MSHTSLKKALQCALKFTGKGEPTSAFDRVLIRTVNATTVAVLATDRCALIKIYARANTSDFACVISSDNVKLLATKLSAMDIPTLRGAGEGSIEVVFGLDSLKMVTGRLDTWPLKRRLEDQLFDISDLNTDLKGYSLMDLYRLPKVHKESCVSVYPTKTCTVFADNADDPVWVAASMPLNSIAVNQDKYATHKERIQL